MDTHEGYVPSVSRVMCHMSCVMCHVSCVTCHVSRSEHSLHGCPSSRLSLTKCILVLNVFFFVLFAEILNFFFLIFEFFFLQNTNYSYGCGRPAADFFLKLSRGRGRSPMFWPFITGVVPMYLAYFFSYGVDNLYHSFICNHI